MTARLSTFEKAGRLVAQYVVAVPIAEMLGGVDAQAGSELVRRLESALTTVESVSGGTRVAADAIAAALPNEPAQIGAWLKDIVVRVSQNQAQEVRAIHGDEAAEAFLAGVCGEAEKVARTIGASLRRAKPDAPHTDLARTRASRNAISLDSPMALREDEFCKVTSKRAEAELSEMLAALGKHLTEKLIPQWLGKLKEFDEERINALVDANNRHTLAIEALQATVARLTRQLQKSERLRENSEMLRANTERKLGRYRTISAVACVCTCLSFVVTLSVHWQRALPVWQSLIQWMRQLV